MERVYRHLHLGVRPPVLQLHDGAGTQDAEAKRAGLQCQEGPRQSCMAMQSSEFGRHLGGQVVDISIPGQHK
jgi:hypothetical protein